MDVRNVDNLVRRRGSNGSIDINQPCGLAGGEKGCSVLRRGSPVAFSGFEHLQRVSLKQIGIHLGLPGCIHGFTYRQKNLRPLTKTRTPCFKKDSKTRTFAFLWLTLRKHMRVAQVTGQNTLTCAKRESVLLVGLNTIFWLLLILQKDFSLESHLLEPST